MPSEPGTEPGTELIQTNAARESNAVTPRARAVTTRHKEILTESDMKGFHDIHMPKCIGCSRKWPFPRQVAFLSDIPHDMRCGDSLSYFEPVTKDMLVIYQTRDRQTEKPDLGDEIFSRLKLTHTLEKQCGMKSFLKCQKGSLDLHRLVEEFDYNRKTGDVTHCEEFFDEERVEDFSYARLLTLNSWYVILLKNILEIILETSSIATGVMLLGQLCSRSGGFNDNDFVRASRYWFVIWYSGCLLTAIMLSARAAHWEWKASSSPNVGDIVSKCNFVDRTFTFAALTVFIFIGVDKLVKDIVKIIHPWKSVQPYAAVKMEGARIHVVGYKSRSLFYVENCSGQFYVLLMLSLTRIILFIYNVSVILSIGNPLITQIYVPTTLRISTCVSMVSAALSIYKVRKLRRQRQILKKELMHMLDAAERDGDLSKKGPASKLLALHFQQAYRHGELYKVSPSKLRPDQDGTCSRCGRNVEDQSA